LLSPQKMLLMLISGWCILEMIRGGLFNSNPKALAVLICVNECHDLIEPVVRCLNVQFQLAGLAPEFTVYTGIYNKEWSRTVDLLTREGLVVAESSPGAPGLVLCLDRQGAVCIRF
jgi:hypothetical protein